MVQRGGHHGRAGDHREGQHGGAICRDHHRAIDLGVNYIDTAAAYGGPGMWSQKYIGKRQALFFRKWQV